LVLGDKAESTSAQKNSQLICEVYLLCFQADRKNIASNNNTTMVSGRSSRFMPQICARVVVLTGIFESIDGAS
jgi:hypothetical protein